MERFDFSFGLHLGVDFIPTTIIYLRISRVPRRLLSVDKAWHWHISQRRRSKKCPVIRASTISMLIFRASAKACLVNQRFHWKRCTSARLEVGAGAPSYPQTAKDHFRRVYCEAVDLMVNAIYQESFSSYAHIETLWLKLLMVTTMSSSCLRHIQRRRWYRGATWACN